MELSMLRDTNGNLLHNSGETNGSDTTNSKLNGSANENSASQQTHDTISDKVIDETTANGSADTPQHGYKNEDKTMHDPTHTTSASKSGTSPPTEHKQHLHSLPLRKRHLLATSTGSHHNDNLGDSNHAIPQHTTGQVQDVDTTALTSNTNNISTEPEPHQANMTLTKPVDSTHTEHTDPPDPPEPPEMASNIAKHPLTEQLHPDAKNVNGDKNTQEYKTKHEHKDLHENDSAVRASQDTLAHDLPANTPSQPGTNSLHHPHNQYLNYKRPQYTNYPSHPQPSVQQTAQQTAQPTSHALHNTQSAHTHSQHHSYHTQNPQSQQPKPPTHAHSSPTGTHSPTGTQSPTRAHSPSSQSVRHSSSRGRGSGRGRGKTTKAEGLSTSTASATNSSSGEELYCFCRRPYDPTVDVFMICCDSCDEWYHGSCVGVNQREAKKIARYVCPRCKKMPTSPTTTSAASSEVSSEDEPSTPPTSTKNKKRKNEASFKTEPKRQALSPPMSDNGVESTPSNEESRYCLNCNKQAMPKSKYCGQDCGLEYARKQYHNNGSKRPTPATEVPDKEALDEIARKKADIAEKLNKLAQEQRDVEKAIQFAKKMDAISAPHALSTSPTITPDTDEPSKNHVPPSESTTIDCISCGHPIAVTDGGATYCNAHDSKSKTFCKKLKNACALHAVKRHTSVTGNEPVIGPSGSPPAFPNGTNNSNTVRRSPLTCGCPTGDFSSGYCELTRKACVKHHNWEELMRDSISNQRTQHNKILVGLEAEEHAVRLRVARRSQAAVSSYRTIEEA